MREQRIICDYAGLTSKITNMRKTLIIAGLLAGAVGAYAQGYFNPNANQTWSISFYSPTLTPWTESTGDSPEDLPAGTAYYTGGWIGGGASPGPGVGATPNPGPGGINYQNASLFEVGLYVDTSPSAVLTDITTGTPIDTDTITDGGMSGIATEAESTLAPGTVVNLGIAAWYADEGFYGSYAAATHAGQVGGYNISTGTLTLGSLTGIPVTINGATIGLTSFSMFSVVPEPSTIALGVIGASTFLLRLRRKQ
jgi:hypothetical protein